MGDKLYLILDGKVRISREVAGMGEEALAVLGPGEVFGEMSLLSGDVASASVTAHGPCELAVLPPVLLLLYSDRPRSTGLTYLCGWLVGMAAVSPESTSVTPSSRSIAQQRIGSGSDHSRSVCSRHRKGSVPPALTEPARNERFTRTVPVWMAWIRMAASRGIIDNVVESQLG